jgi:hypothetical protein
MSTKDNLNSMLEWTKSDILGMEKNKAERTQDFHASSHTGFLQRIIFHEKFSCKLYINHEMSCMFVSSDMN